MLICDFQIVERLPLKLCCISKYLSATWISKKTQGASTSSIVAWNRKQTFPNTTCYQEQQWIFKSTICKLYSMWTPCAKFNTLKWSFSLENFRIQGLSRFILFRFYFKQKYSQISNTSQNISRTQECRRMTIRHSDDCHFYSVASRGQDGDWTLHHLLQCPHKNQCMRWMTELNCALSVLSCGAHSTDNST